MPETEYGPWMLVSRRRGRGGDRGGAGGPWAPRSRAVHANSRDQTIPLPNISKARSNAAWSTRGGSSSRGRGGTVRVTALSHSVVPGERSKSSAKVDGHNAQGSDPLFGSLLEMGVEKNNPLTVSAFPSPEGSLSSELRGNTEVANPNEETPQSLASVLLKGKMSLSAQYQHPMEIHPILRTSKAVPDVLASGGSSESHQMIVDKVSTVLASLSLSLVLQVTRIKK